MYRDFVMSSTDVFRIRCHQWLLKRYFSRGRVFYLIALSGFFDHVGFILFLFDNAAATDATRALQEAAVATATAAPFISGG
mmetsp:Transcript_35726/g.69012  ORF Transcript_35726/g.69012 Transcript_35726/m.69012 type:complete len:81 (+) Transcript_35726:41-283(+)